MSDTKNYYDEVVEKIKNKIIEKNHNEAKSILLIELNMPYIPETYEIKFKDLLNSIKLELNENQKEVSFSMDKILDLLRSENENNQIIGLELIRKKNLRPYINELKSIINRIEGPVMKAILFEILADQEISIDLLINERFLNPTKDSIMKNQEVISAFETIKSNHLSTPQITNAALGELNTYLLNIFPNVPKDGIKLGNDLLFVTSHILTGEQELTIDQSEILKILSQE